MSNTKEKQELDNLLNTAKTFQESELLEGTVTISGRLRKSDKRDSIILIPDLEQGRAQVVEIEKTDVVRHEVIKESDNEKFVRIHVREDALLTVSSKILAKNTLNAPFILTIPRLAPIASPDAIYTGQAPGGKWDAINV